MPRLRCDGRELELGPDENVLDALLAAGVAVASSCRVGACQACLVRATGGAPPAAAQLGLKESLRAQGYFLACQARLTEDLELTARGAAALEVRARITAITELAPDVLRVLLAPVAPFTYRAGQYLTLVREDGLARAYSLASLPEQDGGRLELHVRVMAGGSMSGWLASGAALGQTVRLRGPTGECFYTPGQSAQALVLAGAGTGLAPLWGILRDALAAKHAGPIELWHGARNPEGLYLRDELAQLAAEHANFRYQPCVLEGDGRAGVASGRLDELLLRAVPSFAKRRVYLCGDAALVQQLKRKVFLSGAALSEIHADAFVGAAPSVAAGTLPSAAASPQP
jgi:NAD(P)H-flavin reductase/ferredoxin